MPIRGKIEKRKKVKLLEYYYDFFAEFYVKRFWECDFWSATFGQRHRVELFLVATNLRFLTMSQHIWKKISSCADLNLAEFQTWNEKQIMLINWFVLERLLNSQRQQPGWIQFRHDKSRIEWWRDNRYNVKKKPKN